MKQLSVRKTSGRSDSPRVARWKSKFIAALKKSPDVSRACLRARISRTTAYRQRAEDKLFDEQWREAIDISLDRLEAVAFKRAAEGDTQLICWLLRSHRGQIYNAPNRQEHAVLGKIVLIPAKAAGDE